MTLRNLPILILSTGICGLAPARAQDPDVAGPDVTSRISELQAEKDRLVQEISYVRSLLAKGGLVARVFDRLKHRELAPKTVDAGKSQQNTAVLGMQPKRARLFTPQELESLLDDVICTVQGRPVRKDAFAELYTYLKTYENDADDAFLRSRSLMQIIQTEYAHASFADTALEAANSIREIETLLKGGSDFGETAKNRSQGPHAENGGDLGFVTPSSGMDLKLEQVLFTTPVGQMSAIFRTPEGFNLVRVEEARDSDAGRSVHARRILIPFSPQLSEVREIQKNVSLGQVDLVFRDKELMEVLPPLFR